MKKFELTTNTKMLLGRKLFQIKALVSFGDVEEGELGGFVEKEENLDHGGDAWVYGDAKVYGNAWVYGDAKVYGNAEVYGDAEVYGNAKVCGDAEVYGNAKVCGDAWVYGNAEVCGDAWVYGNAEVYGNADYAIIKGFGTEFRTTTFFKCKDRVTRVRCGCFYGDLNQFREKVKNTRTGKIAEEYLIIADLMEKHFKEEKDV